MLDIPVRVKDALRDGRLLKNYKINVLNDNMSIDFTIDNDYLVAESVKFDERLCSGDVLKFGLCEGASLEFQYFNYDSILGKQIQVLLDIQYEDSNGDLQWYSDLPMGYFTVEKCPQQYSTGIYKATAYNKLMSTYLDANANDLLEDAYSSLPASLNVYEILKALLSGYKIEESKERLQAVYPGSIVNSSWNSMGTFQLTADYGIAGPINSYKWETTAGNDKAFGIESYNLFYSIDSNQYLEINAAYGTLVGFEENFVNCLKDIIDSSELTVTGEDAINYLCANTGFQKVLGVWLYDLNDSYYYSTVQWDYEEANGLTHTVAGPLKDVQNKLYYGKQYNCVLYCPWYVSDGGYTHAAGFSTTSFEYYADSGMTELATGSKEPLKYSDGTLWPTVDTYYAISVFQLSPTSEDLITVTPSTMPNFTLRELQSAYFELACQFGQLSRTTDLFSGVELNQSALYPSDTLYPADSLYPNGTRERTVKSGYSKLWTESNNVQSWRNLVISYNDTNNETQTLTTVVNADGTQDYIMDDNWLFLNLSWDAADIQTYAAAMVTKMQPITWFPFELWGAGLPYVETGDQIEIVDPENNTHTSYVLERQLNGIQNLQDTYINGVLDIF